MPTILPGRRTAKTTTPLVVFLIGMRINRFRAVREWLPVSRAMGPMLAELSAAPDSGFLGYEPMLRGLRTIMLVQYWRDFDSLEAYARSRDHTHWPAWVAFNKAARQQRGGVGIFHETYAVPAGGSETIYVDMPAFGLGKAMGLVPATEGREAARERMKASGQQT
ncbi:DUF4188 domain-containing protein [Novosphingobium capsulatum]|uniref:DUF4188 domain-containing protein n=1 Tax=Novosphingobium capsulatum TaxID=13688 RepID=UPI000788F3E0|nr:DUF4188 domain-containing protein [Novosphingobium capsulatum]WQD92588.1 DUF4188 domain-containing protein [Novosphingobium capsulatum]